MNKKNILGNILIVAAILTAAFLSQQSYSAKFVKNLLSKGFSSVAGYAKNGLDWAQSALLPKISGEAQKGGELLQNEVSNQKENISKNVGEKIKNYFSGVVDSVFNPKKNNSNCVQSCPQNQNNQTQP